MVVPWCVQASAPVNLIQRATLSCLRLYIGHESSPPGLVLQLQRQSVPVSVRVLHFVQQKVYTELEQWTVLYGPDRPTTYWIAFVETILFSYYYTVLS